MSNSSFEAVGCLIILGGIFLALALIYFLIVYVIVPLAIGFASAGVLLGGGKTIANYIRSFQENILSG